MADELVDTGYPGLSMDRSIVATLDRLLEGPGHMADIDEALDGALVAITVAAEHVGQERDGA
jgi:hypothetical protein